MRRNVKKGGGDVAGATRLAGWVGMVQMGLWLFRTHLSAGMGTFGMFLIALSTAIFYAFVVRTMYLALEPHVRRRWPQTMISWTAVLTGHWRDPIVGRDVLAGAALAVAVKVINQIANLTLAEHRPARSRIHRRVARNPKHAGRLLQKHSARHPRYIVVLLCDFHTAGAVAESVAGHRRFHVDFLRSGSTFKVAIPLQDAIASLVVFALVAGLVLRFGLLALATFIFVDIVVDLYASDCLHLRVVLRERCCSCWPAFSRWPRWGFHTSIAGPPIVEAGFARRLTPCWVETSRLTPEPSATGPGNFDSRLHPAGLYGEPAGSFSDRNAPATQLRRSRWPRRIVAGSWY